MRAALPLLALLAACAPVPHEVSPEAPRLDAVARECRLLEAAHAETAARGLTAWPDILTGCPDHPAARDRMSLAQMSAATRAANAARLPESVQARPPRAALIYRRMITRGVPESVAEAMAERPEFAAASAG